MKMINSLLCFIYIICINTSSFDLYCHDISEILDLESDNNDNNHNQAIPNIAQQIPNSPNAFDSFDQQDTMDSLSSIVNGAQDDFDVSIVGIVKNLYRNNALIQAATANNLEKVKNIINTESTDVNYQNRDGQTALHIAALYNYVQIIRLLLDNQANIDIVDHLHRTPLILAVQNDSVAAVEILRAYGADIAIPDNDDKIAVDYARSQAMKDILY